MDLTHDVVAARRHIIKRPRLTRLLDETTARIILLVGPAGYGKTTLAREWLEDSGKEALWYYGGPRSSDVAALAADFASLFADRAPRLPHEIENYFGAHGEHEIDPTRVAQLFLCADELASGDLCLVIDDYHAVPSMTAAEDFLAEVVLRSAFRVVLTTRVRPHWATPRRLLYDEIREVGQSILAMTESEAHEVLAARPTAMVPGIIALADGWPAVIGLAALVDTVGTVVDDLLSPLHDFLAAEIFDALHPTTARALARLSACRVITPELVALLTEGNTSAVIGDSIDRGLLMRHPAQPTLSMHPLLKDFLERKLRSQPAEVADVVAELYSYYQQNQDWDEAFHLITSFNRADLIPDISAVGYRRLLNQGRAPTLERWLDCAHNASIDHPVLDLVDSELAFRRGGHAEALASARRAARALGPHPLAASAWNRAGQSAFFLDRVSDALDAHESAEKAATTASDLREALWGQFTCFSSERPEAAARVFSRLQLIADSTPQTALRLAHAEVSLALRRAGSLREPLATLEATMPVSERCNDPLVRSSFLHSYCYAAVLAAEYERAQQLLEQELRLIQEHGFEFALPHVFHLQAAAALGLRQFTKAGAALDKGTHEAERLGDVHSAINIATLRIRFRLALGDIERAILLTDREWHRIPTKSLWGEWQCTASLAYAAAGESQEAAQRLVAAERVQPTIETHVLASCIRAILAPTNDPHLVGDLTSAALDAVRRTANYDSFVSAYRACPELMKNADRISLSRATLSEVVRRAKDVELAADVTGVPPSEWSRRKGLSKRELEVLDLVAQGRRNKEIARLLHISESTVKVHLRHILEKLGARSRAEAASLFASWTDESKQPLRSH